MAGKGYIWQKTKEALDSLTIDAGSDAIDAAKRSLAILKASQPQFDDDDAREAWERLMELMNAPSPQMSADEKTEFTEKLWRVFSYSTGIPSN